MSNDGMTTGARATKHGIESAVRDVTHLHQLRGRAAVQAMTEEQWRARAEETSVGIPEDWREPFVLAYVTAAQCAAAMLSELN